MNTEPIILDAEFHMRSFIERIEEYVSHLPDWENQYEGVPPTLAMFKEAQRIGHDVYEKYGWVVNFTRCHGNGQLTLYFYHTHEDSLPSLRPLQIHVIRPVEEEDPLVCFDVLNDETTATKCIGCPFGSDRALSLIGKWLNQTQTP